MTQTLTCASLLFSTVEYRFRSLYILYIEYIYSYCIINNGFFMSHNDFDFWTGYLNFYVLIPVVSVF